MKSKIGSTIGIFIIIIVALFLAVDVGYSLYKPDRLDSPLSSCSLDVISGEILVMEKEKLSWSKAEDNMIIEPGTRVRTTSGAEAIITFSNGSTTKLEPGTDVVLTGLENSDDDQPEIITLKQQAGKTWNKIQKEGDADSFRIRTSSADVVVHGTLFSTEVSESGETHVETTEGEVSVTAEGKEVRVNSGEMTTVQRGAMPSNPAVMPPAPNELVFTIGNRVSAMVTDPGGSSTGQLDGNSEINQISGSRITAADEATQEIRIPNARTGEYTVLLRGVTESDSLSVAGYAEGQQAFIHSESSNTTSTGDMIVKLHCDVVDGILQSVSLQGPSSQKKQSTVVYTASPASIGDAGAVSARQDTVPRVSNKESGSAPIANIRQWFDTHNLIQWITGACVIVILGTLYIFITKRS